MANFYKVGGCVRDSFIGRQSKDIDYSVEATGFEDMRKAILERGGRIFLEKPEFFTIRAKVPQMGDCDFVLCRKDGEYTDGRRPDSVEHGTIYDDLKRRDFTMNAIAENESGLIFDPFEGRQDIEDGVIRCVGKARNRFSEDSLRLIRAIRFSVVLDFCISCEIRLCLRDESFAEMLSNVSIERIREEMLKAFKHDTLKTLRLLEQYPKIRDAIFCRGLRLEPTLKK